MMYMLIVIVSLYHISYSLKIYQYDIRILSTRSSRTNLNKRYCNSNSDDKNWGRPDIIPYDDSKTSFAREDRLIQKDIDKAKAKEEATKIPKDYGEMNKVKESKWQKNDKNDKNDKNIDNSNRGTGYNLWNQEDEEDQLEELEKRLLLKKENDDQDDDWLPSDNAPSDNAVNAITKFFKNVLIDSPYDSRRKLQAKYVVRNIFGFSLAIGIIFTSVWYLFPGKFISYRGDTDFTARYQQSYSDPSNLLNEGFLNNGGVYFDDAKGLPIKDINTRVPYEPSEVRAPLPSQEL